MPHLRQRHIELIFKKVAGLSPLVGVLGHRQVGKTTFLEKIANSYYSLDQLKERDLAEADPEQYVSSRMTKKLVAIDECQLVPELFPALKEHVRKLKRPGQFVLSGSVRFTSRKAIRESLTGRIINLELLPMTLSELEGRELPGACKQALESRGLEEIARRLPLASSVFRKRSELMRTYQTNGGLPGICFVRDEKLRSLRIDEQLRTLLDRDLRLIQSTTLSMQEIRVLCSALAKMQGEPIDYTRLKMETRISLPTIKKLIFSLEAIFLIRLISVEGGRKGPAIYFEDQAEARWLRGESFSERDALIHFCFTQIRAQFEYRVGERVNTFQYRTRGGAFVPLAYRNHTGNVLGVIPIVEPSEWQNVLGSANSFLKSYSNSQVLILHTKQDRVLIQPRIFLGPAVEFF